MWTKISIGVYCVIQGAGLLVVFPLLGSFLIGVGTGLLINVILIFNKSEFESNEALFSEIEQTVTPQAETQAEKPPKEKWYESLKNKMSRKSKKTKKQ